MGLFSSLFILYLCSLILLFPPVKGVSYNGPGMDDKIHVKQFDRHVRQTQTSNTTETDNHIYYNSVFYSSGSPQYEDLWFDLTERDDVEITPESGISEEFRVFLPHDLPFDFQFYGHTINTIAVTTGGFLYTSDFYHANIHLTQYIAPLQADFNPSLNDSARVIVYSGADRFTVQWDAVHAAGHVQDGTFTFQVSLFRNGTIHFVYRNVPLLISQISDEDHPVEVGLADAFYVDRPVPPNNIQRFIFEYSRIRLSQQNLNYTAYVLTPVANCISSNSCSSCVAASATTPFDCSWCSKLNRCSDGYDRFRQEWVDAGCSDSSTTSCPLSSAVVTTIAVSISVSVFLLALLVFLCLVIPIYGYLNPTSSVGLFMIEHRPKARSLNKSSTSYNIESGKTILSEDQ